MGRARLANRRDDRGTARRAASLRSLALADRGTALMLMPAGVLIVVILGALAVDSAILFLGERELADLTAAAANDAATVALDEETFYRCGRLRLIEDDAVTTARTVAAARASDAVTDVEVGARVNNAASPPEVTVTATGTVRLVFTPALPGTSRSRSVQARSIAMPEPLGPGAAAQATC